MLPVRKDQKVNFFDLSRPSISCILKYYSFDFSEHSLHLEMLLIGGGNPIKNLFKRLHKEIDNPKTPKNAIQKVYLETGFQVL